MENRLLNCIKGKDTKNTPIWFMRQAGRYLPEFREIRKENPDFIKLCLNPNLVNEITLQPIKRFDIDAAIIFSDILMIPYGLGQKVEFKKGFGPQLENINLDKIINTDQVNFVQKLLPVYKGIEKVRNNLEEKNLEELIKRTTTVLNKLTNWKYELIFVNDILKIRKLPIFKFFIRKTNRFENFQIFNSKIFFLSSYFFYFINLSRIDFKVLHYFSLIFYILFFLILPLTLHSRFL